ncbi:uncharacterized protein H6S33_008803 [Morchella sextelata]|uniref:uncharacterized protein n=1 Tax=Morchella sextelata TaxID=1174677 RepID=UPI001D057367|nr:uncharacterized protein H6S33_008803 [Morchella sextelata]KAH0602464.1 hypothetical protein H6S33_008803 [Morchella sextelata]
MDPTKRSSGSAPLAPKHPRLPRRPEEHEDLLTDESEIPCRPLTPLPARTRSSQSTTAAQIARKGILRSSETPTGRSSPRRVEFHLPGDHTDLVEAQEQAQVIEASEVEEIVDTSHSEYDDSPEKESESSEENEDEPEDEPQASTQRSQTVGKRPRTAPPTTAKALGNARRKATGAVAERGARLGTNVIRKQGQGRAAPISEPSENASQRALPASQRALPASQRAPTSAPSQNASQRPLPASQRAPPIPTQSRPSEPRPYRSSPPIDGIGESSVSSPRIPSSPQIPSAQPHSQIRSQGVYEIDYLPSSRENENALMAEREVHIPESTHDVFENTGDILSSQLTQRSLLPNSRSANVLSMQAQRIEKECSILIGEHTLVHEPFPPAARLSILVVSMWATASRRVGCRVDFDEVVIKQVRSLHSRVHSHLMHEVKGSLVDSTIYGLGNLVGPEARAAQVEYLLKNDRFLSPQQHYETYRLRFLAPEIVDILYFKYFDGVRMRGVRDPEFLERITPTPICLISTAIWHGIRVWSTGTYVKPDHFQSQNESVVKLCGLPSALRAVTDAFRAILNCRADITTREATLEVIKDNLREKIREKKGVTIEVIPEDGFRADDEALAADLADEVIHAQLRGIDSEEEGEEEEEEQELPVAGDCEGGGEEDV